MRWTRLALTLSLMLWATASDAQRVRWCLFACEIEEAPAIDTLCTIQGRMILSPADAAAVKNLPVELQRRVVKNETRYRCKCEAWKNPICGEAKK